MSLAHRSRFRRPIDHVARTSLLPRARLMRLSPTLSEDILWQALRRGALGVRFRRQVVLGGFIVDFFAPARRLVVEVDGPVHLGSVHADRRRDDAFHAAGIRVVRVLSGTVESNLGQALAVIRAALD